MFPSPNLNLRRLLPGLALSLAALLVGCGGGGSDAPKPPPVTDTTPPAVTITDDVPGVAAGAVTFTFAFSEPINTSFTAAQVAVTNGTKGTFTRQSATSSTLVVMPNAGVGTMTVTLAAGAFKDMIGNASARAFEASQDYDYTPDTTPPTVVITDDTPAAVATGVVTFTFTFDEPIDASFTKDQITVTNGSKGAFARTSTTVSTLAVTPIVGTGTMTVTVAAGAFKDLAQNPSIAPYEVTQDYIYTLPPKSAKRGFSLDTKWATPAETTADLAALSLGTSWWYNWNPNATVPASVDTTNNMEFIPMFWGGTFDSAAIEAQINAHPGVQYLLVVNEPNFSDQANMTPQACATLWPQIEALSAKTGVKIVGPAMGFSGDVTYGDPVKWLDAFYAAYKAANANRDPQIDALAAHWYDYGFDWFLDKFAKYNKPLWVTEFANWHSEPGWVIDTVAKQKDTMKDMVGTCEYRSDVERYAWFMGYMATDPHFSSLLSAHGQISEIGQYYLDQPFNTGTTVTMPTTAAAAPTDLATSVISLLSGRGTYTSIPVTTWKTSWSAAGTDSTEITLGGSSFRKLKYTTGLFLGMEGFEADITGKTTLHFDYWTPEGTTLKVKIVDFGADNAPGGTGTNLDTETPVTLTAAGHSAWNTAELNFSAQANTTHIRQLVFEIPAVAMTSWYIDNLYFK